MRAMILAAGLGTRLRPLTDDRPKALVEVNRRTLLEVTLTRLRSFGISEVILNVHHFAEQIVQYLAANDNFGMQIEISREEALLDTGGGLKKAAPFLLAGKTGEPFLLHNVDVISNIDFHQMLQFHGDNQALVTLAVQDRPSSRNLLFDDQSQLCGRKTGNHAAEMARPTSHWRPLAFCGIHIISPRLFPLLTEEGTFPLVPAYLQLVGQGEKLLGYQADAYYWRDLGTVENLSQAARDLREGTFAL